MFYWSGVEWANWRDALTLLMVTSRGNLFFIRFYIDCLRRLLSQVVCMDLIKKKKNLVNVITIIIIHTYTCCRRVFIVTDIKEILYWGWMACIDPGVLSVCLVSRLIKNSLSCLSLSHKVSLSSSLDSTVSKGTHCAKNRGNHTLISGHKLIAKGSETKSLFLSHKAQHISVAILCGIFSFIWTIKYWALLEARHWT